MTRNQKIVPSLWYAKDAEQAAKLYASVFPDSGVDRVSQLPAETPSGPAGTVTLVDLTLFGQAFQLMSATPIEGEAFNHTMSFTVMCEDQREIDRYWNALVEAGGTAEPCGWVKDRYGVSWQIVPRALSEMVTHKDTDKAKRATEAMLKMQKLDLAKLQQAFDGR